MPLLQEKGFHKMCDRLQITKWGDLFQEGVFRSKEQLVLGTCPSPLDLFLYTRLRQGMRSVLPDFPQEPVNLAPLHQILGTTEGKHLVSRLYHSIRAQQPQPTDAARPHGN